MNQVLILTSQYNLWYNIYTGGREMKLKNSGPPAANSRQISSLGIRGEHETQKFRRSVSPQRRGSWSSDQDPNIYHGYFSASRAPSTAK